MSTPKAVVVGAGAIGLSCALALLRRGADVTVIESDPDPQQGASASVIAAGMLAPISEAAAEAAQAHSRAVELGLASFDSWRAAPAPLLQHARFGGALLIHDGDVETHGRPAERIGKADIGRRFDLDIAAQDALFIADEGVLNAPAMLAALAHEVRAAGGRVHFGIDAETVETAPLRRVRGIDGQSFTADFIVLAPGIWARPPLQEIAPALKLLQPAKGVLAPALLEAPLAVNVRGPDFYLAPRSAEDVVLGSTMEFGRTDRGADPAQAEALFAAATRALPGQVRPAPGPVRAGVRPMSPDWAPLIGPNGPEGVLVACGHSRNGWLLAPITGEIIAAYVFGEAIPDLWSAFAPSRFG